MEMFGSDLLPVAVVPGSLPEGGDDDLAALLALADVRFLSEPLLLDMVLPAEELFTMDLLAALEVPEVCHSPQSSCGSSCSHASSPDGSAVDSDDAEWTPSSPMARRELRDEDEEDEDEDAGAAMDDDDDDDDWSPRRGTASRPYACPKCPKTYTKRAHLKTHLRVHTGERPYKCKHCDWSFSRGDELTRHMTRHTGEKRHVCEVCSRAFGRRDHLNTHLKLHQRKQSRRLRGPKSA